VSDEDPPLWAMLARRVLGVVQDFLRMLFC